MTWRNSIGWTSWSGRLADSDSDSQWISALSSSSSSSSSSLGFHFCNFCFREEREREMRVALVFILLSFGLCLADQISPFSLGSTFSRSSREPKYKIELHSEDSPYLPNDDLETVVMPNDNGESYLCYLPKVEKVRSGRSVPQVNTSSMIMESEKRIKLKTPDELLDELKDQCFVRQEGWWLYEFCYHKKLRQVHVENEKVVQEFILGQYDAEATAAFNENLSDIATIKDPRSSDASQRYHPHQYTNGTLCDLTNQPRETEVRFVCSEPRAMISSFTEVSTCKYALTIRSPTLCAHPLFQAEKPVWYTIHCNALPKDHKEVTKTGEDVKNRQIVMATESEERSNSDSSK